MLALTLLLAASGLAAQEVCWDCHDVDPAQLENSVHAGFDCTDCHVGATEIPHDESQLDNMGCIDCHQQAVDDFERGVHGGVKEAAGESWVSGCLDCHGDAHDLRAASDPASPVHPQQLATTCGRCHADPKVAERYGFSLVRPLAAYLSSVHARKLAEGEPAATCNNCHGNHAVFRAADPRSLVNHQRVPQTCGQCHSEITQTYLASVHGQAAEHGIEESPVCTDCHGEHHILDPTNPDSPVYATNIPKMTCGRCHGDLRLTEKFGMPDEQVPAWSDSFHGLASRSGSVTVANCASCHGVHDILPSSDPRSHTNPEHLAATCGQCHPGAGTRFAIGPVHVLPSEEKSVHPLVYWARIAYLWIIFLTIGGMLLHNGFDLFRKAQHPHPRPTALAMADQPLRLSRGFRVAHALLAVSFIVLAITGFSLKFPEAWWSQPLLRWESGFGLRGWLHRFAALVMLGAAALHIVHLALDRHARRCIAAMRPGLTDWHEIKERLAFFFGRRKTAPPAPWVGYPEKMEYLAVVWGTVVMALTGFALWFETIALRWLPTWAIDLATVVHFYEAVLATLAILVWHFYAVFFDPLVYPMDTAWLTGRSAPGRAEERKESAPRQEA